MGNIKLNQLSLRDDRHSMGSAKLMESVVSCKSMAVAAAGVCMHDSVGSFLLTSSSAP